jgi:hypothetical protein
MLMKTLIFVCFWLLVSVSLKSQSDSIKLVEYDSDFQFSDGVFLSFDQVKKNRPINKARIIAPIAFDNPDFFDIVLSKPEISFYDEMGLKQTFAVKKLWGYSKNGNLYIRMYDLFNRITYMGSICHFLATITVSYQPMYDPYYYNPYYYYQGWNNASMVAKNEVRQFIMDFSTGKILDFDEKNVEILIMSDHSLYDEYMGLKRRKKQQLKFYYIRKFNERNPLKIPVYE